MTDPRGPADWAESHRWFHGDATPENLLESMKKHSRRDGSPHISKLPPKKDSSAHWDIDKCDADTFPFQTHHLIPKKFLPEQSVCVWLTDKYTKNPKYQLAKDARYSTDHSNNGYCLPFVPTCHGWKHAKSEREKTAVANEMMFRTNKQLHQGNHNTQDFGEEDAIEPGGLPGVYQGADEAELPAPGPDAGRGVAGIELKESELTPA